jgi:aryl-alcohol dehydrogenase-like predicted oxidoreductase
LTGWPKPCTVPIPGTTKLHQLDENLLAMNAKLTLEDMALRIDAKNGSPLLLPGRLQLAARRDLSA